jgi:exodeoxyribonuclease VIII
MEPGIHCLPLHRYHDSPGVSKSNLDLVHRSPALLEWSRRAPVDDEARGAVSMGSALHALLLEPERFEAEYVGDYRPGAGSLVTVDDLKGYMDKHGVAYEKSARKSALVSALLDVMPNAPVADAIAAEWARGVNGRAVLSCGDWRKLMLMRESVLAHPMARKLVEDDGFCERSYFWNDPETGELCRCRPDREIPKFGAILDVKTSADIEKFSLSIRDYRYAVQDAFYSDGVAAVSGEAPRAFIFLVVSTTRDAGRYPVRLFSLSHEDKLAGREEYRADLATYSECRRTGIWGGIEMISGARSYGK